MHIYACVRVCVSVWMRACGRRDYRVRVCPRETHAAGGRPHTRTRRIDVATRSRPHSHAIPGLRGENRVC